MTDEERERVIARNEAVYREVNEAIERGRWPGEEEELAFRCECAKPSCAVLLKLTHEEYERLRSNPRRFAVASGHEQLEAEDVVETTGRYVIVEKRGQAARIAEESDPRP